jgi:S-methylmethionine-dependent homocysteine/selenocysteine methylase
MEAGRPARVEALHRRIAGGHTVILDGGTGTGLQAKGAPMDSEAWSGIANLTHPDLVRELHEDYLRAGAAVIITNTFAAGPGALAAARQGERFEEANRRAVELAREARDRCGAGEAVIAGSMSRMVARGLAPSDDLDTVDAEMATLEDAYGRQAQVLAEAGVDVIALEMMGALAHARPAVAAAAATGLPVWLGVSVATAAGGSATTIDDEDLAELVRALAGSVDAVFIMHSDVDVVSPALDVVTGVFGGALGAYPHVGDWTPPNWVFHDIAPERFAAAADDWADHGARLVGGCCGIGPEHIAALAARAREE